MTDEDILKYIKKVVENDYELYFYTVTNMCKTAKRIPFNQFSIFQNTRKREIVFLRQIAMVLGLEFCKKFRTVSIGKYYGGRHHSTCIHAKKTIKNQSENYRDFRFIFNSLFDRISAFIDGTGWPLPIEKFNECNN
jgi:chromosomal replication initiation ATPase DnaA